MSKTLYQIRTEIWDGVANTRILEDILDYLQEKEDKVLSPEDHAAIMDEIAFSEHGDKHEHN